MPNHFLTVGLCARDHDRLDELGLDDHDQINLKQLENMNLCALLAPLPEDLQGIVSSSPRYRFRNKLTGELWVKDNNGPPSRRESPGDWETVDLTPQEIALLEQKHGAADWYDWQTKNCGTKWGIYDLEVREMQGDGSPVLISFVTAWTPPAPEMMKKIDAYLCKTYCLKNIKRIGHDPYDGSTVGIQVAI